MGVVTGTVAVPDAREGKGGMAEAMSGGGLLAGMRTLGHWAVAAASVGLVAGMTVWAHDTLTREIEGVPVIKAQAGAMRVAPRDAGGADTVPDRALSVGRVAEGRGVAAPPQTVEVAATGTDLSPEDFVAGAKPFARVPDPVGTAHEATGTAVMALVAAAQAIPADVPGLARSLRPAARPALAPRQASAPAAGNEIDPARIAPGTPLAQLGAFPDAASARAAWAELAGRHESLLGGRDRLLIEVPVAGRVLWRLRVAGFEARTDSVQFCAALSAAGSECIPTVHG